MKCEQKPECVGEEYGGHEEVTLKGNSGCEMKRGGYNLVSPGKERLELTVIEFRYN